MKGALREFTPVLDSHVEIEINVARKPEEAARQA